MHAQHRAIRADERPRPCGLRGLLLEETAIVTLRHEADLLALLDLVRRQPDRFRLGPYVLLAHAADGKEDAGQPCPVQAVQEIALVLPGIPSLMQVRSPRVVRQEPRVVAGGNVVRPHVPCGLHEASKLHPLVAPHAAPRRQRCPPRPTYRPRPSSSSLQSLAPL